MATPDRNDRAALITGGSDANFIAITREQRDALLAELVIALDAADTVVSVARRGWTDYDLAARDRLHTCLWLLDDLAADHRGDEFYVTVPRDRLARWLRELDTGLQEALRHGAEQLAHPERFSYSPDAAEVRTRLDEDLDAHNACRTLLAHVEAC